MNTDTNFEDYIGKVVRKTTFKEGNQPKPFKSGLKENTVKGIVEHPILKIPAFTFVEDNSYVECRRCVLVNRKPEYIIMGIMVLISLGMIVNHIVTHYTK